MELKKISFPYFTITMRILHTADLHLGQTLYHHYLRDDEHRHFFKQLKEWILEYKPDVLLVCGDIFDVPRPSSAVWQEFTKTFVDLHDACSDMCIVIIAGNHDSPSTIQAHSEIWKLADTYMIGSAPPAIDTSARWEENYIIRLKSGYIVALPFMANDRMEVYQRLLEYVNSENENNLPVILTGHLTITGSDITGHSDQIGNVRAVDADAIYSGFDYMALGHIHRPQTINHADLIMKDEVELSAPVIRYSGSALHVSCDETYPHSVSLVDVDSHSGKIRIKQLWIEQLRHFYTLPLNKEESFTSEKEVLKELKKFAADHTNGYIRLRIDYHVDLSSDFNNQVYSILEEGGNDLRYNPKIIWTGKSEDKSDISQIDNSVIDVAELQQMTSPMEFVISTLEDYPTLTKDEIIDTFKDIEEFLMNQDN